MMIPTTWLFKATLEAQTRYIVHQGGARSSKTYSIIQALIRWCSEWKGETITVVRRHRPSLRFSAEKDFFEIIRSMELYSEDYHDKTNGEYELNHNLWQFVGVEEGQKVRGSKRTVLWLNEANELKWDDALQLIMRTTKTVIIDYNPSEEHHWIYDEILENRKTETTFIKSTYKDNPFLESELVREIERLEETDDDLWRVFGKGERAVIRETIYRNWREENRPFVPECYGLDFGYEKPTALVGVLINSDGIHASEEIYQTHLTNAELIAKMNGSSVNKSLPVYCDSAEPNRIEELRKAGFNAKPANKDVHDGIDFCIRYPIILHSCEYGVKEIKSYKRKRDRDGNVSDDPVKYNDHFMDAMRYGSYTHYANKTEFKAEVRERELSFSRGGW